MTIEEREIIVKVVDALNNISGHRLYKVTQSDVQMKPKSGENDWNVLSVHDTINDLKQAIKSMETNLIQAKEIFIKYQTYMIKTHEKELAEIAKNPTE